MNLRLVAVLVELFSPLTDREEKKVGNFNWKTLRGDLS